MNYRYLFMMFYLLVYSFFSLSFPSWFVLFFGSLSSLVCRVYITLYNKLMNRISLKVHGGCLR